MMMLMRASALGQESVIHAILGKMNDNVEARTQAINSIDAGGYTASIHAAANGEVGCFKALVTAGSDLKPFDSEVHRPFSNFLRFI
jgi:ankyrin repeat protein